MKSLSDKISYFFLSFIMLAIIVSFAFTGFEGISGGSNSVATVDGTPITKSEYSRAYEQLLARYSQSLGKGKSLTRKQIKDFRIEEQALNQVVRQKYLLNYANSLELKASPSEVKDRIKEYPFFQTAGKFDVSKYKQLLAANRISPSTFEEETQNEIKMMKLDRMLAFAGMDSKAFVEERMKFQSQGAKSWVVTFAKEDMTKNISVPSSEVKAFIADEKNQKTIDSLYKTYSAEQQFQKKTPKKMNQVKNEIVTKHLQRTKRKELTELVSKIKAELKEAMESGSKSKLSKLSSKYGVEFIDNNPINPLSINAKNADLEFDEVMPLFKNKDTNTVLEKENTTHVTFVKMVEFNRDEIKQEEIEKEWEQSRNYAAFATQQAIVKYSEENSKVVTKVSFN
ncbi:MAG: hypothetical protein CME65_15150 [Halobacteriovoraceae bacterium]|nr:hypothetical protein [Halobacteriovoraceae bacterium]